VLLITRAEQTAAMSDIAFFTASADAVAHMIENAERITVPAPSHVVDPETLAPVLTDFLRLTAVGAWVISSGRVRRVRICRCPWIARRERGETPTVS
jgi:hypothetical protein